MEMVPSWLNFESALTDNYSRQANMGPDIQRLERSLAIKLQASRIAEELKDHFV